MSGVDAFGQMSGVALKVRLPAGPPSFLPRSEWKHMLGFGARCGAFAWVVAQPLHSAWQRSARSCTALSLQQLLLPVTCMHCLICIVYLLPA